MLVGLIGLAAALTWLWAFDRPRPVADDEIRRLQRVAEAMRREQALPFD